MERRGQRNLRELRLTASANANEEQVDDSVGEDHLEIEDGRPNNDRQRIVELVLHNPQNDHDNSELGSEPSKRRTKKKRASEKNNKKFAFHLGTFTTINSRSHTHSPT